ncbi:YtxH domain-containing protein [Pedobacter mucosus]|uniref:YtxH domain-containing protein n=1 Tax=Pedobacter mucosus TaxID=2895286 RepID=UPI001EE411F6|nr:YtxH domain-containing protein [Pedobacter mucosus]UKT62589.1 YtxH domain-containing protein [Pedobacter mucosus]
MKDSSKIVIALFAGVAAGAALGILFAPEPGEDTRDNLSRSIKKITDKVKDFADNELSKFNEAKENVTEQVKEKFESKKEEFEGKISDQNA